MLGISTVQLSGIDLCFIGPNDLLSTLREYSEAFHFFHTSILGAKPSLPTISGPGGGLDGAPAEKVSLLHGISGVMSSL